MQIEISDATYRLIQQVVARRGGEPSAFVDETLASIAKRLVETSPPLPAALQAVVDEARSRGPTTPASGVEADALRQKARQAVAGSRSAFSGVAPEELQGWIDDAVADVEALYRSKALDAAPR